MIRSKKNELNSIPAGFTDDASRLNQTRIAEICSLTSSEESPEGQLRAFLQRARSQNVPLSIAGTRHTMGRQSIYSKSMLKLPMVIMKLPSSI